MKEFIFKYMDLLTLSITLVILAFVSYKTWKSSGKSLRLGVLPFLFLGPVLLITCMSSHLFEVSYHAIDTGFTGKFSLRFHLYTLVLMPLVLGNAGVHFFRGARSFARADAPARKVMLRPAGVVALILFPLMWLTPLSFLMYLACALSLGASFLVHKQRAEETDTAMLTLSEATAA